MKNQVFYACFSNDRAWDVNANKILFLCNEPIVVLVDKPTKARFDHNLYKH